MKVSAVCANVEGAEKLLSEAARVWQPYDIPDYLTKMTGWLRISANEEIKKISGSFARLTEIQKSFAGEPARYFARELATYNDLADGFSRWIRESHDQLVAENIGKLLVDTNGLIERLSELYSELPLDLEDGEDETSLVGQRQAANLIAEKMEEIIGSKDVFRLPALIERLLNALKMKLSSWLQRRRSCFTIYSWRL